MKTIEEQLKDAHCVTPDLPLHRAQLRRALLSSQQFEGSSFSIMKRLIPASVLLLLILGLSFTFHPENTDHPLTTPTASAQEVLASVVEEFQSLTDEEIAALNEKLGVLCGDVLSEARNASDLHLTELNKEVIDGETIYTFSKDGDSFGEIGFSGDLYDSITEVDEFSVEQLTFLTYTRTDGTNIILGVDPAENFLPAIIMIIEDPSTVDDEDADSMAIFNLPVETGDESSVTIEAEAGGESTVHFEASEEGEMDYGPVDEESTVTVDGDGLHGLDQ